MADANRGGAADMGGMAGAAGYAGSAHRARGRPARGAVHPGRASTRVHGHGAICGAAFMPTIGRGHVDLERGVFYRRAVGATRDEKAPAACPATAAAAGAPAALASGSASPSERWSSGTVSQSRACARAFAAAVRRRASGPTVTPHILRHTARHGRCRTASIYGEAAGFLGMTVEMLRARVRAPPSRLPARGG